MYNFAGTIIQWQFVLSLEPPWGAATYTAKKYSSNLHDTTHTHTQKKGYHYHQ